MQGIIGIVVVIAILVGAAVWGRRANKKLLRPGSEKKDPVMFNIMISEDVKEKAEKQGYEQLSAGEKTVYCIEWLWSIVETGGFEMYYTEEWSKYAKKGEEAFARIGAVQFSDIVRRANAVFGDKGPAAEKEIRKEQLRQLGEEGKAALNKLDKEFYKCEEDWQSKLSEFIAGRREEFSKLSGDNDSLS